MVSPHAWRRYLAVSLAFAAVYVCLSGFPEIQAWIFIAATIGEAICFILAWRLGGTRGHPVWQLIGLSVIPYVPANVLRFGVPVLLGHRLPSPSPADALYVVAYGLLLAGLVSLIRRSGRADKGEELDAAVIFLGAAMVVWVLVIERSIDPFDAGRHGQLVTLAYPAFDLALVAIVARMIAAGRGRTTPFWLVAASLTVQLVTDVAYSASSLDGTFRFGGVVTLGYLLQYALLGAAVLHPSAADVASSKQTTAPRRRSRLAVLAGAAAVGPGLLLFPGVRGDADRYLVAILGSALLLGLTLVRLSRLMVDVDTYRATQQRLRDAELRYRTLVEHMPGVVYIAEFGESGEWSYVSPKIQELLGFTLEEWMSHPAPWSTHVHHDDLARAIDEEYHARDSELPLSSTYRMFARDGRMLWIHDEAALVPDEHGVPRYWQGVMTDVTPVKETEHQLRSAAEERRRLLDRLVTAQEEERLRVANDIHDDPIQKMTAVGLRLAALKARASDELRPSIDQLDASVSLSISRLRRLMFELRPAALDRDGLEAALCQYLQETAEEAGFEYELRNEMVVDVSPEVRASAYRIAQEALSNVRKHAAATSVWVRLESRGDGVLVRVEDDGVGFLPNGSLSPRGHIGLMAMRERAELAGGWLRVDSRPGHGTSIDFWLPDAPSPARDVGPDAWSDALP